MRPVYSKFKTLGRGKFHFGYVYGIMVCRLTTRDGQPTVQWRWDGNDEMVPTQGRSRALLKDDELHGMIYYQGDESDFVATLKKVKDN